MPSEKLTKRRNEYVHKTVVPNPEAALEYCSDVYDQILKCVLILKPLLLQELQKVVIWENRQSRSKAPSGSDVQSVAPLVSSRCWQILSRPSKSRWSTPELCKASRLLWGRFPRRPVAMIREQRLAQEQRDSALSEGISPQS